jgi:hypothetical protein
MRRLLDRGVVGLHKTISPIRKLSFEAVRDFGYKARGKDNVLAGLSKED